MYIEADIGLINVIWQVPDQNYYDGMGFKVRVGSLNIIRKRVNAQAESKFGKVDRMLVEWQTATKKKLFNVTNINLWLSE